MPETIESYYVWADGEETGPFSHADVIRMWVGDQLPKGFLWRRGSESEYRPPSELYEERTVHRPTVVMELPPPKSTELPKFELGFASSLFGSILIALGILAILFHTATGATLIFLGQMTLILSAATAILKALGVIAQLLDKISRGQGQK